MCFIFLFFTWITSVFYIWRKKNYWRTLVKISRLVVVAVKKMLQRGIFDDETLHGILIRCDSQLFCDALLVWPVLLSVWKWDPSATQITVMNLAPDFEILEEFLKILSRVRSQDAARCTQEHICFLDQNCSSFPLCCGSSVLEEGWVC